METDFYEILGLSRDAEEAEIKNAYRRLVREHHPDVNTHRPEEAGDFIKRILLAYATLSDFEKRARYDRELAERSPAGDDSPSVTPEAASLLARVRLAHDLSPSAMAATLGLSESALATLEARDAIPQTPVQLRTFVNMVDQAARRLEDVGDFGAATALRTALSRKKSQRAFLSK